MSKNIFFVSAMLNSIKTKICSGYSLLCLWCFVFFLSITSLVHAQEEGVRLLPDGGLEFPASSMYISNEISGATAWTVNGQVTSPFMRQGEVSRRYRNVISFYVNESQGVHYLDDFTATVSLLIEYKALYTETSYHSFTKTLTLDYKKGEGQLSDVRQYIHFEGAEEVKVTVTGYTFPSSAGSLDFKNILILENAIVPIRYYDISTTAFTLGTPVLHGDRLNVSWTRPANPGNNAIQLEWAWLENELESNYFNSGGVFNTGSRLKLLNAGATRVELGYATPFYDIPMLYAGLGKLHYRVRGVSIQSNGTRIYGPWSAINSVDYEGHENALNWQVTTSFAEEGKHKTVIQYYDGSLRPRQVVTKDNVTLNTIIGETLYDHEGRPAIQVLPAPGIGDIIAYQRNLNKFNSPDAGITAQQDNQNPADYFDHYFSTPLTPTLQKSVANSAAQYYSDQNPAASGTGKDIPDAEGYPYTVTRYMPDATGRIKSQSGVGDAMKMGSGRETKYYYGSPKQEELDALFGTEVGDKSHYFKNMVQDANGQMSISYTDMHGRTIATALAGDTTENLRALDVTNALFYPGQNHVQPLSVNLLDSNTNIVKGNAVESVNSLLVPYNTIYNFRYTLTPESLSLPTCEPATPVCYDCLYDLELAVIDESGDREQPMLFKRYNNLSVDLDTSCITTPGLFQNLDSLNLAPQSTIDFSVMLPAGSYTIRKTLTISEQSIERLRANYLTKNECYLNVQVIFDSVYAVLKDSSRCDLPPANPLQESCDACNVRLGTTETFRTNYLNEIGASLENTTYDVEIATAYKTAKKNCDLLCGILPLATVTKRELMLADMKPFYGQYAKETATGSMAGKYNIFSQSYSPEQPWYQAPLNSNGTPGYYLNNLGLPDESIKDILGTVSPQEFDALFRDKWAEALLPNHPEYQRLLFAEEHLSKSYNWVNNMHNVPTYSLAQDSGFLFNSSTGLTAKDPFFGLTLGDINSRKTTMTNKLVTDYRQGLNMWQYAYLIAICRLSPTTAPCVNPTSTTIPQLPFTGMTPADKDSIWSAFKGLYLQERGIMMDAFVASNVSALSASDHTALLNQGYILHFPKTADEHAQQARNNSEDQANWNYWPSTPGGAPNLPLNWNTPAQQQDIYARQCQSYIDMWKQSLEQCPALQSHPNVTAIINSLTYRMVEICRKGSSDISPRGASTVAPSTPVDLSFRSFEALITHVLDSLSINRTDVCNPYVIEYPRAYGMGRKVVPSMVTVIDSCNCNRFTEIKTAAIVAGKNPAVLSSLNQYLSTQYGDTLTQSLFDALNRCGELNVPLIGDCDTLSFTISAPCGSSPCAEPSAGHRSLSQEESGTLQPVLKMQGDSIVVVPKAMMMNDGFCPWGQVWDPIWGCVDEGPVGPQMCFDGWTWDPVLQMCTAPGNCPIGYEWSYTLNRCVEQLPQCDFTCISSIVCDTIKLTHISLASPSVMPDFMQCGYSEPPVKTCYTCTDIKNLVADFKTYFPSPYKDVPYQAVQSMDEAQMAYMRNLARYINFKTGMNYTWIDYMQAIDSADCNLANGGTGTVICRDTRPLSESTDIFIKPDPCQQTYDKAWDIAQLIYNFRLKYVLRDFESRYRAKCMAAKKLETFTVNYVPKEYHYTLYYYDQAGNLVKTVPPAGVRPDYSSAFLDNVKARRNTLLTETPSHQLVTEYRYNSLNQVVVQQSPDGGTSKFWYDKLGRLAVSQNAKQVGTNQYSYTLYDELGRIKEVGQKQNATAMTQARSQSESLLNSWIMDGGTRDQLTQTVYDKVYEPLLPDPGVADAITQRNLRNRVSYTMVKNLSSDSWQANATFYTYDIHGNVDKVLQDYRGVGGLPASSRFKTISYRYDLVSGKVNEVAYQAGQHDAFYHRYFYDAGNRITSVMTSRDSIYWETDARYEYYKHGPLARTILGKQEVQGIDYVYTLQGWLKGVNSTSIDPSHDVGRDGHSTSRVARDIFGFGLHYYDDNGTETDYKAIGGGTAAFARPNNGANFKSLYNGNIAAMTVNNGGLKKAVAGTTNSLPLMYNYQYDQLNRIVAMRAYQGLNEATNAWAPVAIDDYQEAISYDPNGNIKTYVRNGAPSIAGKATAMDNLGYHYNAGTNQLNHVTDNVSTGNYIEDIDGQSLGNYGYDAIGNLTKDVSEGITDINWTVYGKIASITKNGSIIGYTYDAGGQRITKTVAGKTVLYVRDASGNVMSVYEVPAVNTITQKELHLYGSRRLGMALPESTPLDNSIMLTSGFGNATIRTLVRGEKLFELSNHLGNVMVAISDKKIQIQKGNPNQYYVDYYTVDVITATDYAPFGMQLFGREFSIANSEYRYGFNGVEKDYDISSLSVYDYGFRIYNPIIGRFLSVDPLTRAYPWYTPYQFAGNNPIWAIDLDGLEEQKVNENTEASNPNDNEFLRGGAVTDNENVVIERKKSFWKRAWNFTKREIFPRVVGAVKTAAGVVMVTGGAMLIEFGVGAPIIVVGGDLLVSGARQTLDGKHHKTLIQQSLETAGMDENSAAIVDASISIAAGTTTGAVLSQPISNSSTTLKKVDLFGGQNGGGNGFINYDLDPKIKNGIVDDVMNFSKYFGQSSVDEIVANNPQAPFLQQVESAMVSGGTITVRGGLSNKFFNKIWDGKAEGLDKFKVISKTRDIGNSGTYRQNDGVTPVSGVINEIILMKK